jgi:hypothetical protein
MPIANDRNPPQCRDGANFVRLGHCGAGHPELLSARFPPRPLEPCDALGRSQVVRQRILIPPSGGSNPPAPATHSRNWETSPYAAQSPAFCGPLRTRRLETDGTGRVAAVLSARSPMPIFNLRNLPAGGRDRLAPARMRPVKRRGAPTRPARVRGFAASPGLEASRINRGRAALPVRSRAAEGFV